MAGGILQLVAVGIQDNFLTGTPEVTFFKLRYSRYTNFAVECIENSFNGTADLGKTSVTSTVSRNGDLMSKVYLRVRLRAQRTSESGKFSWVKRVGHALVKEMKLSIGGSTIDKYTGSWQNAKYELARNTSLEDSYNQMIGNTPEMTVLSEDDKEATLYVPLDFFFTNNYGSSLPLVAMQYHEVQFQAAFESAEKLLCRTSDCTVDARVLDATLLINYVYLDTAERKEFAKNTHEMLIEQVQVPGEDTVNETHKKIRLTFNHPTKYIVWSQRMGKYNASEEFLAWHPSDRHAMKMQAAKMVWLLGHEWTKTEEGWVKGEPHNAWCACNDFNPQAEWERLVPAFVYPDGAQADPVAALQPVGNAWMSLSTDAMSMTYDEWGCPERWGWANSQLVRVNDPTNYGVYLDGTLNPLEEANIQLNGSDRFSPRDANYFNYVQPYECAKATPCPGVNLYSFALKPFEVQPSGTINFSRVDYSQLTIRLKPEARRHMKNDSVLNLYACNYNVLRCMSGMAGIAFSN